MRSLLLACILIGSALLSHASDTATSRYAGEVGKLSYRELPSDETYYFFRWNFAEGAEYLYDFEQLVNADQTMDKISSVSTVDAKGLVAVKAQPGRVARLVFQDMDAAMSMRTPDGQTQNMTQRMPNAVLEGMSETSELKDVGNQTVLVQTLFPLPVVALKPGGRVKTPVNIPLNAMGSQLQVRGEIDVTYVGLVDWNGIKCAQLDYIVEVGKFDKPPEIDGNYKIIFKGTGRGIFDLKGKHFKESISAFVMEMEIDAPVPDSPVVQGNPAPRGGPRRLTVKAHSDNRIHVKRK